MGTNPPPCRKPCCMSTWANAQCRSFAASRRFASPGCPCAGALRPPSTCSARCDHEPRLPPDSAAPAGGRPASSSSSSSTSSSDPPGLRHCPVCVTTARRSSRRHLQHCATLQWYQHTAALPCFLSCPSPFSQPRMFWRSRAVYSVCLRTSARAFCVSACGLRLTWSCVRVIRLLQQTGAGLGSSCFSPSRVVPPFQGSHPT